MMTRAPGLSASRPRPPLRPSGPARREGRALPCARNHALRSRRLFAHCTVPTTPRPYFAHGRVVLVTANVRLGVLGFAALDELRGRDPSGSTGNYGMQVKSSGPPSPVYRPGSAPARGTPTFGHSVLAGRRTDCLLSSHASPLA